MQHPERAGIPADRIGRGTEEALRRAYPATTGDAIAAVYPPDEACDARLESLIEQLERIPSVKERKL